MQIVSLTSFILAAALVASSDQIPLDRPSSITRPFDSARTLVAVEGRRRLNLACVGRGNATVVFLSGLGGGTFDWRKVQPAIGRVARACAYDRAGYGYSDPASAPSDLTHTVKDLHALLGSNAITRPVILVGHSLGGLFATDYALRYPRDVAGIVLVDPAFNGQETEIAHAIGPRAANGRQKANKQTLAFLDNCIAEAEAGRLSLLSEQGSPCLDNPPDPDPNVHRQRDRVAKRAAYHRAVRSEYESSNIMSPESMTINDHQSARSGPLPGTMPVVVMTRGKMAQLPGLSDAEAVAAERAWRTGHRQLARLSSSGSSVIVPHAGHYIQLDQPDMVIRQVLKVAEVPRRRR